MTRPIKHQPGGPIPPEEVEAANTHFQAIQAQHNFRYRCEDCMHLDPDAYRCVLRYPTELFGTGPHRCRSDKGELLFCKYFELT